MEDKGYVRDQKDEGGKRCELFINKQTFECPNQLHKQRHGLATARIFHFFLKQESQQQLR
jgi:hypothetical protein